MEEKAIVVARPVAMTGDLVTMKARYQTLVQATREVLRDGVDYGVIPGTGGAKTLLKPGAEKLSTLFGLRPTFRLQDALEDWDGGRFHYRYRCILLDAAGQVFADAEGSCNSLEKKYRWRDRPLTCPTCGQETIIKGRAEYGGGWLCWKKRGGCGAKFQDGDQAVEGQETGRIENPEPYDLVNTLQKMAQKRALVAAVLVATGASEFFTQDMEDLVDATYTDVTEEEPEKPKRRATAKPKKATPSPPHPAKKEANGNGRKWPTQVIDAARNAGLAKDGYQAVGRFNLSTLSPDDAEDVILNWLKVYDEARATAEKDEAAAIADAWLAGEMEDAEGEKDG